MNFKVLYNTYKSYTSSMFNTYNIINYISNTSMYKGVL